MKERCVALLGRRDEPTDAVEEYCHFLGAALAAQGISLEFERVPWCELGWRKALAGMDRRGGRWKNDLGLVHDSALAWSRPGLPLRLFGLLRFLSEYGGRCGGVVPHGQPHHRSRPFRHVRPRRQL